MNANGYKQLLTALWKLQIGENASKTRKNVAALIAGMDGVGKNFIAEDWARDMDKEMGGDGTGQEFNCVIIKPGQGDSAGDFLGLPQFEPLYPDPYDLLEGKNITERYRAAELSARMEERHGKTFTEAMELINDKFGDYITKETTYSLPGYWPRRGKGLLILDELNRGGSQTESALLEVVRERKLSLAGYKVPEDWMVIGLINPPTADFIGVRDMDAAMESRFVCFNYIPETEDWLTYAKGAELDETVRRFIKDMPQFLGSETFDNPILSELKPRPRRVEILCDLLEVIDKDHDLYFEVLQGTLGKDGALAYQEYANVEDKPIPGKKVLSAFKTVQKDLQRHIDENRSDLLSHTVDTMLEHMDGMKRIINEKETANLCAFIKILNKDLQIKVAKQMAVSENRSQLYKQFTHLSEASDEFTELIMATLEQSNQE